MRSIMENHLLTDPVVKVRLAALKRSHILDYRERLIEKLGYTRTVQEAVGVLKTILKEAYFREDISRDPTVGIGSTRYQPKEIGVFTADELKKLFPAVPPGPGGNLTGYTVFLMAAITGMWRGEILALTWECVSFQEKCIEIRQAWKDRHEMGPPKWGKTRVTPMPNQLAKALEQYRAQSSHAGGNDLVFCYDDGTRIGNTCGRSGSLAQ